MKTMLGTVTAMLLFGFVNSYSIPSSIQPPDGCNDTALRLWLNQACYQLNWDNSLIRGKRSAYEVSVEKSEVIQMPRDDSLTNLYEYLLPHPKKSHHYHHHHSHHHHNLQNEDYEMQEKIAELLLHKMRADNGRQKRRLYMDATIPLTLKDKCCRDVCFIEDLRANC